MTIRLLGTAGPRGWPEPGCPCASCARLPPGHRGPLEVQVDGTRRDTPHGTEWDTADGTVLLCSGAVPEPGGPPYATVLIDLLDSPERLGLLRRRGLAGERTQVVAVGLDHRIRSEEELERRLAFWGAVAVPDGTTLGGGPEPARTGPRRTLVLGGARSGKSGEAELRLAAEPYVTSVATGPSGAGDADWAARVERHRTRRPAHWDTVETTDLAGAIAGATAPLLIDGLGTWLAAVFDACGAWDGDRAPVEERCAELRLAWRHARGTIVAVSDEVGLGVVPSTSSGRAFRDALGRLNEQLAEESDAVVLAVAGRTIAL